MKGRFALWCAFGGLIFVACDGSASSAGVKTIAPPADDADEWPVPEPPSVEYPKAPASGDGGLAPEIAPYGYFGSLDLTVVQSGEDAWADQQSAATVMVLKGSRERRPHSIVDGKFCLTGKQVTDLDGVCQEFHGQDWCTDTAEQKKIAPFAAMPAILSYSAEGQTQVACSGVAVGPTTVATASHCVVADEGFVIANYTRATAKVGAHGLCVPLGNVFRIVTDTTTGGYGVRKGTSGEVSIMRVEPFRKGGPELTSVPVCSRADVPSEEMLGQQVHLYGHPLGLPQILSSEATILDHTPVYAYSSLDAFDGFSGGPVFSTAERCVLAIHRKSSVKTDGFGKCCRFESTKVSPPFEVSQGRFLFQHLPRSLQRENQ